MSGRLVSKRRFESSKEPWGVVENKGLRNRDKTGEKAEKNG